MLDSPATPVAQAPVGPPGNAFDVLKQKVWLDINPLQLSKSIRGRAEITVLPQHQDARLLKLNCRQARITSLRTSLGKVPITSYKNAYSQTILPGRSTANQWHQLQNRLDDQLKPSQEPELSINLLPKGQYPTHRDRSLEGTEFNGVASLVLSEVTIFIEFQIERVRDGLQFVGCDPEDQRYPHVYTHAYAGSAASSLFPCFDDGSVRNEWEMIIRTPKTIGDALAASGRPDNVGLRYSDEDKARDLLVVCSGDLTDEIADKQDTSKKETSFRIESSVLAHHIGFAVGPFEQLNLSVFRESGEDDKLGKSAIPVHGFCLPGRAEEVRNTCFPLAKAVDFCVQTFHTYPYKSYKITFVDDMIDQGRNCASLTLCSSRLLFPEDILEPMDRVTRYLAFCVASQWFGVNVVAAQPKDTWVVVGLASYMADVFMKKLAGTNAYRYHNKRQADRVFESDVRRPCLLDIGRNLWIDPSQEEFLALKASMVMFILDRRLVKANGTVGLSRIIFKLCLQNSSGDLNNSALDTEKFMRICEKHGHLKLDSFFAQWVEGAGCPQFLVTQRFNKKRLVVEMQIKQVQHEQPDNEPLRAEDFVRDVREEQNDIWASEIQPVFRGPMTIRIHEADGTPYEHIVEIKDMITRIEIPYNTKYKRLKRTRRYKEKLAQGNADEDAQAGLYMLGDNLQSEEEVAEWRIAEFSKEDEDKMNSESFEWIRMDADFEWLCRMHFNMPPHMYLSQLQQDRDVVAQLESITYFANCQANPLISSFLIRTLMDQRYFYGIRSAAATALHKHAKDEVGWIGLFHLTKAFETQFCLPDGMIRPNDFSNRSLHYIQCAIVRSMGMIRDNSGRAPYAVRKFLNRTLRFNDNSTNDYSDAHFLQAVMRALGSAVASAPPLESDIMDTDLENADDVAFFNSCLEQIDRQRRLDEWLPSYHNVVALEGLHATFDLMKAGRIPRNPLEFVPYTQVASHADIRIAAFNHLLDLGYGSQSKIMAWLLFTLSSDASPYVRNSLLKILGRWLGMVATGQMKTKEATSSSVMEVDGLVLESDADGTARVADEARKKTVEGALAALKADLGNDGSFKESLWTAVCSLSLTIFEIGILLEICSWLYEPVNGLMLVLKYPRYWKVSSEGISTLPDGSPRLIIRFKRTQRARTKMIEKWVPPMLGGDSIQVVPKPGLKRKSSTFQPDSMPAPKSKIAKRNSTPNGQVFSQAPGTERKPSLKLKLKMPGGGAGSPPPGVQTPRAQTPGAQTPGGGGFKLKLNMKPPTPGVN